MVWYFVDSIHASLDVRSHCNTQFAQWHSQTLHELWCTHARLNLNRTQATQAWQSEQVRTTAWTMTVQGWWCPTRYWDSTWMISFVLNAWLISWNQTCTYTYGDLQSGKAADIVFQFLYLNDYITTYRFRRNQKRCQNCNLTKSVSKIVNLIKFRWQIRSKRLQASVKKLCVEYCQKISYRRFGFVKSISLVSYTPNLVRKIHSNVCDFANYLIVSYCKFLLSEHWENLKQLHRLLLADYGQLGIVGKAC